MYCRTIVLLGTLIAGLSSASAQDNSNPDRRFYIAPSAVWQSPDGDRTTEPQVGYGVALGKVLGRGSNLELSYEFLDPEINPALGEIDQTFYGLGLQMFPMRNRIPFYILARLGRGEYELSDGSGEQKAVSDQFNVGAGYLLSLGDWPWVGRGPALRIDMRYQYDKFSRGEAERYAQMTDLNPTARAFHDVIVAVGLQIPLGPDPDAALPPIEDREPDEVIVIAAVDSDGDQIPDTQDDCPDTASGASVNVRGCEWDTDGDGVVDGADQCPGTASGLSVDARGCAADADQDGVLNLNDQCPTTPAGKPVLADGCAPSGDCRVPRPGQAVDSRGCVANDSIVLRGVNFENNSSVLSALAKDQLDAVALVLKGSHGVIFEVGGHTDSVGDDESNRKLSEARAVAVKNYLVQKGVAASALSARGYGETQPLARNESESGRAKNRRVELRAR